MVETLVPTSDVLIVLNQKVVGYATVAFFLVVGLLHDTPVALVAIAPTWTRCCSST